MYIYALEIVGKLVKCAVPWDGALKLSDATNESEGSGPNLLRAIASIAARSVSSSYLR